MGKILLYIDEDSMDEDFVQALRSRNVDVLTLAEKVEQYAPLQTEN